MVRTMSSRAPHTQRGFTATELVVVIAILGILAAFAAPSMTKLMVTQKVRSVSYDLFADLSFARSEAISRGHNVQIAAQTGGTDWVNGWTITDTSASPNVALRKQGPCTVSGATTDCAMVAGVTFTADVASLTFDRTGRTSQNASFNIVPTDTSALTDQKRCIKMDPSGRPRTLTGACP